MPRATRPSPAKRPEPALQRLYVGMLMLVLGMAVPIVGMRVLQVETAGGQASASSSFPNSDDPRSCTSTGTMFMGITRPIDAINLFQNTMSDVVAEREALLRDLVSWQCFGGPNGIQPPPSPALEALASQLPGWHYKYTTDVAGLGMQTVWIPKPVHFESFASVVAEFLREYECKLAEFQPASPLTVRTDQDLDGPDGAANPAGGTYCCAENSNLCVEQGSLDVFGNPITCLADKYSGSDPVCNRECTVSQHFATFGMRVQRNFDRMTRERIRARAAVERTVLTLRSFETSVIFAVQMSCFQRAGLDLKNELAMLADGSSCMPKIWDSVNGLHDLKSQSPPEL